MDAVTFDHISKGLESVATVVAFIVGAIWTYRRFIYQGENNPKVAFDVDMRFIGCHNDQWLVEAAAIIENKGLVRQTIRSMKYELRAIRDETFPDPLGGSARLVFPDLLASGSWFATDGSYIFVEAGVKSQYVIPLTVSVNCRFLCLMGRFTYERESEFFYDERIFAVPQPPLAKSSPFQPHVLGWFALFGGLVLAASILHEHFVRRDVN
jgi:hypothetical protein